VVSTKAIPPGGETQIKASVNTKNRRGDLKKTITVTSNDPKTPALTLTLNAQVITDLIISPAGINLGQLTKGQRAEKEFSVEPSEPQKVHVVSLRIEDKRFVITPKSKAEDNKGYTLRFSGSPKFENINATIEVEYQGAQETIARIPISVGIVSDLIYPKYTYFYKQNGGFSPRDFSFTSRSKKKVVLISAKDPGRLLKLTMTNPSGPSPTVRVEVAKPNDSYSEPKKGVFIVKTNNRDEPAAEINYTITEPGSQTSPNRSSTVVTPSPLSKPAK
jgi:hypothetical protein